MKLTDIAVNRSITSIMISVALIILGFVSARKMPMDLIPDIEYPMAMIMTEYKNVGPKEIETNLTRIIEQSMSGINNVDSITSTSREGMSLVTIQFTWGHDMALAMADIRQNLDMIERYFPDEVEKPMVFKFDTSMMPTMMMSVKSNKSLGDIRAYAEDNIQSLLEQVDGVASAQISGGYDNEVKVELNKNRMDAYNLSIDTIVAMLRMENMNISGGDVKTPLRQYTLRTVGEFTDVNAVRNIVVTVKQGTPIYLKDIAVIKEEPAEKSSVQRLNGKDSVSMIIYKQSDKNTVLVSQNVLKKLEEIKPSLPPGMEIVILHDSADYIRLSISTVIQNAIIGGIIAVLTVFLFLRNIRASLILGLSIPISIIATFIAMYYFDFTLNMMSMGGLAIGVGMLIDNSIVILENIFRFRERGARPSESAKLGADEMAMAITASTLTTICVFLPFLFTEGLASQIFKQMALTISFSLLISLLVALTLVPTLTSKFIKTTHIKEHKKFKFLDKIFLWSENTLNKLETSYGKVIRWALAHRFRVVVITVAAIIIGFILLPITGMEFIPESEDNSMQFSVELPIGTNLDTTESVMLDIETKIFKVIDESEYIGVSVSAGSGQGLRALSGGTNDNTGRVEINLKRQAELNRPLKDIKNAVKKELEGFPGATINYNAGGGMRLGIGGAGITIEVYGYDLEQSAVFTHEIVNAIRDIEGLVDVDVSRKEGFPEKVIKINRDKASKMGLNAMSIASHIKNNVAGITATRYRKSGRELDVVVRLREEDRQTMDDILGILIMTPMGKLVPLGNVVDIETRTGPSSISRKKQERVVYINCKAEGRPLSAVVSDIREKVDKLVKPTNFSVNITGSYEDMQETFGDLILALVLAIALIYIIMASLFESLWSPFIIMFTVPTMIFGVMVFLFLTGTTFNVISFVGLLMLSGIVVNNGIVFIDYTNILRARGLKLHDALVEAGTKRLRPIMMTTLTTILGLIPMAVSFSEGSELSNPLARSVLGGLSSSFIFTLVFLPVVYSLMEGLKNKITGKSKTR